MKAMDFTGPKKKKKRVKKDKLESWKWPYLRRSGEHYEFACPHGIGHSSSGIHGCDGCCSHPSFKREVCSVKRLFRGG